MKPELKLQLLFRCSAKQVSTRHLHQFCRDRFCIQKAVCLNEEWSLSFEAKPATLKRVSRYHIWWRKENNQRPPGLRHSIHQDGDDREASPRFQCFKLVSQQKKVMGHFKTLFWVNALQYRFLSERKGTHVIHLCQSYFLPKEDVAWSSWACLWVSSW